MTVQSHRRAAFSLVEITLALGIMGFALVAIIGLLGVGLNASRDSIDETALGLIAQDVANRVRVELSSVAAPVDSSGQTIPTDSLDLRWNSAFPNQPGYAAIGNNPLPPDPDIGSPGAVANAYYSREGVFVREATAGAEAANYYKAAISISPLPTTGGNPQAVTYASLNLNPTGAPPNVDYPLLAVTVKIGWPALPTRDGRVPGTSVNGVNANAAKTTFTFFLAKP